MMIPDNVLHDVFDHANACAPLECCGVIVRDGDVLRYMPCRNIATDSRDFEIDPDDYAVSEDEGEIVMIVHSHVFEPARASMADMIGCERSGLPWLIVQAQSGAHAVIEPSGFRAPLVGRPYCYGVLDCQTLVRDWYSEVRGIELEICRVAIGWWARGEDVMRPHLVSQGFRIIGADEAMPGDVLLMQFGAATVPQHSAVMLEGEQILHHITDRDSGVDVYGRYWRAHTVDAARYVGKQAA